MFSGGHGLMNRYRTLTLKEIHKTANVSNVFKKCTKAGHVWCDICQCEFSYSSNSNNFSINAMNRSPRLLVYIKKKKIIQTTHSTIFYICGITWAIILFYVMTQVNRSIKRVT